jgi:molecular chaperone HtpG
MATTVESPQVETHQFQAETRKLLDLMIHSLYTQKEIFLRELVSNASDACDRLRFEALSSPELMAGDDPLEIHLEGDKEARTLTISDNGIGMSREEVIANIGTIAKSGSQELMARLREAPPTTAELHELIGQFGVGFYSAFMAADKLTLVTRRAGEESATRWESTGDGTYTLASAQRPGRGTSITLHLKPADSDAGIEDYTERWTVSRIVKRYSDFVAYPIIFHDTREVTKEEKDEEGRTKEGETETVIEKVTLNSMKPIWTRPAGEVTEEDYAEFYKHISHDWNPPMRTMRFEAEGRIEYQVLCFIPSEASEELYYHAFEYGLQLYVRRVKIMDRCEDLVPRYLRFVRGVVDSEDLPLNISRQRLQEDRHIAQIRKWITRKVLETLQQVKSEDAEKYLGFWEHFGRAMKEGLTADFDNKEKLLPLMLWQSSADPEKLTTLAEYKERMQEGQEHVYYLSGESRAAVDSSPHLEAFKAKGYEVLYLTDPVDELVVQYLHEYDDKRLKSVGKGEVDLEAKDEEEKKERKKQLEAKQEKHKDLLDLIQKKLDREIKWVRFSGRLTASPACLVGAEHDYSPQLEKLLMKGKGGGPKQRWILELNPDHELLVKMEARYAADKEDPLLGDYAELLLGYAQVAQGSELTDRVIFNQALAKVMVERL